MIEQCLAKIKCCGFVETKLNWNRSWLCVIFHFVLMHHHVFIWLEYIKSWSGFSLVFDLSLSAGLDHDTRSGHPR